MSTEIKLHRHRNSKSIFGYPHSIYAKHKNPVTDADHRYSLLFEPSSKSTLPNKPILFDISIKKNICHPINCKDCKLCNDDLNKLDDIERQENLHDDLDKE
jgi:hypothetical protein